MWLEGRGEQEAVFPCEDYVYRHYVIGVSRSAWSPIVLMDLCIDNTIIWLGAQEGSEMDSLICHEMTFLTLHPPAPISIIIYTCLLWSQFNYWRFPALKSKFYFGELWQLPTLLQD